MKKCASCSKDLPEAALHCVFCGAKQPPAPAVQPGLAKTAFGYSANEVMDQLGRNAPPQAAPQYTPPTSTAPYGQRPQSPSQPPPYGQPGYAPVSASPQAKTVAISPSAGAPPMAYAQTQPQSYQPPQPPTYVPPSAPYPPPSGMGINAPNPHTPPPINPLPGPPPYGAHTGSVARPIEPWRDSLRLVMFAWGAVALATWVAPLSTNPIAFRWEHLSGAPAKALVLVLLPAAVGLLSIIIGAVPLPSLPRGAIAAALGLVGLFLPWGLDRAPDWQEMVWSGGVVLLAIGLVVRHEYTSSLLARIAVTLGVIAVLAPLLVPDHGEIPLVMLFKALINAPGIHKLFPIYMLAVALVAVLALLAWMPGPATAGAKFLAWGLVALYTLGLTIVRLIETDHFVEAVKGSPGHAVEWAFAAACYLLVGYGVATVIGKQLE